MMIRTCISILVVLHIAASAGSALAPDANVAPVENSMVSRVREIFAKADELAAQAKQRLRERLSAMSDEELARVYAQATAPQPQATPSAPIGPSGYHLEAVKKDRQKIIEQLAKQGAPYDWREHQDSHAQQAEFAAEIAAMGPAVVPVLFSNRSHWILEREAIFKIGSSAVEPLIVQTNSNDVSVRQCAIEVLSSLADARAKDVLLRSVNDESSSVRRDSLSGLMKLGPKVVGNKELVRILIEGLQDQVRMWDSVKGLGAYGDESAIEPLRVIERYEPGRGGLKGKTDDPRYTARQAINAILQRAGKPAEEVEPYSDKQPDYDAAIAAASCPNAAIRSMAMLRLEDHHDDGTARFLMERLHQESKAVLPQLIRSLGIAISTPRGTSELGISASIVQEAFDAIVPIARADSPQDADSRVAAISAADSVLYAACDRQIPLDHVDSYKAVIRQGLSSSDESARIACYSACTAVARLHPPTSEGWTAQEKEGLVQQLAPFLSLSTPNIRLMECLGFIADKRLTLRFIELLGHDDPIIRTFAADALGHIGDARALPILKQLSETDPYQYENGKFGVREAARRAVAQIEKRTQGEQL